MAKTEIRISGDIHKFAQDAGQRSRQAFDLNREDFQLRALKYPLLRLQSDGVTEQARNELAELAVLAFDEHDVSKAAEKIQNRNDASPIAVTIAQIVASAMGSKRMAMLGAVMGAHAAHRISGKNDAGIDVIAAIIGSVCLQSEKFVKDMIGEQWKEFAQRET